MYTRVTHKGQDGRKEIRNRRSHKLAIHRKIFVQPFIEKSLIQKLFLCIIELIKISDRHSV